MDRIVDCLARELAHGPGRAAPQATISPPPTCPTSSTCRIATATRSSTTAATSAPALEAALGRRRLRRAARASRRELRARGIYRGIGLSGYVEGTGHRPVRGRDGRGWTPPAARWSPRARARQGQGHETSFAQIAADALGHPARVGDRGRRRHRGHPVRGRHVRQPQRGERGQLHPRRPSGRVRDKLVRRGGARCSRRRPPTSRSRTAWSRCAARPASAMPLGRVIQACAAHLRAARAWPRPTSRRRVYHHQPTVTYTSAVHVALVEVDAGTGAVKLLRYVVAHDCGAAHQSGDRGGADPRRRGPGHRRRRSSRRWSTTSRASS